MSELEFVFKAMCITGESQYLVKRQSTFTKSEEKTNIFKDYFALKRFLKKMKNLIVFALIFVAHTNGLRYIKVGNSNSFPIWIETQANSNQPALTSAIVQINPGSNKIYDIKDSGWGGRLWAKVGCDKNGANCASGQSVAPCPSGGCQPPAETKVEFFFPSISSPDDSYYDISLVS